MENAIEHGGEAPDELIDLELMEAFGWTERQLREDVSLYMRRLAWFQQQMKIAARVQANERNNRPQAMEG